MMVEYATIVYRGLWFSPEREMLQNMFDDIQKVVTGTVRLKLYKGSLQVVGRKSPLSLYSADLATFEEDSVYDQADAGGFIRLNALRLQMRSKRAAKK